MRAHRFLKSLEYLAWRRFTACASRDQKSIKSWPHNSGHNVFDDSCPLKICLCDISPNGFWQNQWIYLWYWNHNAAAKFSKKIWSSSRAQPSLFPRSGITHHNHRRRYGEKQLCAPRSASQYPGASLDKASSKHRNIIKSSASTPCACHLCQCCQKDQLFFLVSNTR